MVRRQYFSEESFEAVDAGEKAAVGSVVGGVGGEGRLGGGAGVGGVREVDHAYVDALERRRRRGRSPGARALAPRLRLRLRFRLRLRLSAPRLTRRGRVRHPAVGRVRAGRMSRRVRRYLPLLVPRDVRHIIPFACVRTVPP